MARNDIYSDIEIKVSVQNVSALVSNFYKMGENTHRDIERWTRRWGRRIRDLTRQLAPIDTGRMKRLVKVVYTQAGVGFEVGWWAEDFAAENQKLYPVYQEFGKGTPSLVPAYATLMPEAEAELRQILSNMRRRKNRTRT